MAATSKPKNERAQLELIRRDIASKLGELAKVDGAALTLDEARDQVRSWISASAEQADVPGARYFLRPNFVGPLTLVHTGDRSTNPALPAIGMTRSPADDLTSMFCRCAPEGVEALLVEEIEATLEKVPLALPAAERSARLATLRSELHALEVSEERLVRTIEDRGIEVARRPDARPEIILALDLDRVSPAAA